MKLQIDLFTCKIKILNFQRKKGGAKTSKSLNVWKSKVFCQKNLNSKKKENYLVENNCAKITVRNIIKRNSAKREIEDVVGGQSSGFFF